MKNEFSARCKSIKKGISIFFLLILFPFDSLAASFIAIILAPMALILGFVGLFEDSLLYKWMVDK
jgi:hypothetical protein